MLSIYKDNYQAFKRDMDEAIRSTCKDFVKVGYYLKEARDTGILKESGYTSMKDFAKAEYGIDASTASRFISICEKYSVNGDSMTLKGNYGRFEVSKLSDMLMLPDSIAEELPPEVTRKEIRDIKAAVQEEEKATPIELMLEGTSDDADLMTILRQYLHDNVDQFKEIIKQSFVFGVDQDSITSVIAAPGYAVIIGRIQGKGRAVLNINGNDANIVYVRTEEKRDITIEDIVEIFRRLLNSVDKNLYSSMLMYQNALYEFLYNEKLPEDIEPKEKPKVVTITKAAAPQKDKIAPAQPKKEPKEDPKVEPKEEPKEEHQEEPKEESQADQTEELEKESDKKSNLTNKPDDSKLIEYDNKYIIEKANQIINEARESNWSIVIKLADGIKDAAWWRKNRTDE